MADLIAALADEGIRHCDLRYGAGSSSKIPCPRARNCGAKNPADPCLSVSIDGDGEGATWNCHRGSCGGWTDGIRIKRDPDGFAKRETRVFRRPKPVEKAEQPDTMLEWFAKRGIDADTVKRNRIYRTTHWFPSMKEGEPEGGITLPCIAFPYYRDGVLVNVKYRSADKRFLQEKDAEKTLYGIDDIGELDWCVLVEGEMDCLALEMAGFTNALSVPDGAPERISEVWACPDQKCTHSEKKRSKDTVAPLCPKHKRKMEAQGAPFDPADDRKFEYIWNCWDVLERMKKIILAVDDDAPGRALAEELSRRLGRERCWQVVWPKIELVGDIEVKADANAVLVHLGEDAVFNAITNAKPWPVEDIYTAGSYLDAVLRVYRGEISKGETTGFANLDEYFRLTGDGKLIVTTGIPAHGKALALDTLIPTPLGWTTMGEIKAGDLVYDENGQPCTVTAATDVMFDRPCFRVRFDDGTEIVADAEHQWFTISEAARRSAVQQKLKRQGRIETLSRGTDQRHKMTLPGIVTTAQIAETLVSYGKRNHHVPACKPVQGLPTELPIEPYTLGVWLGDGRTQFGGVVIFEDGIRQGVLADGYRLSEQAQAGHHTIRKIQPVLRVLGVLGDKHIPTMYLRASVEQRLQLLRGLMDTDGSCAKDRRCEFTSINRRLAEDVHELVSSFGIKATIITGRATLDGRDCGAKYRVCFTTDTPVFTLSRKLERQGLERPNRISNRIIVACEPVPSVPVRCIQVDSPSHLYLASKAFIPTHNSEFFDQLAINYAANHGWSTAYCSFENPPELHIPKLLEKRLEMPFHDGGTRTRMGEGDLIKGMEWLDRYFTFMQTTDASPTLDWILDKAKTAVIRHGIRLLIIDPYNRIEHQRPHGTTETEYIAQMLDRLQRFGRSHGCDVIFIAHPRKLERTSDGTEPIPTPYDISGAAHFFNMADWCITVWRDRQNEYAPVQVHVKKVKWKHLGKEGFAEFVYDRTTGVYASAA